MSTLHATDRYAWLHDQIARLRGLASNAVDVPHLVEELEELAAMTRAEARKRVRTIVAHLLKLEHSPSIWPRRGWRWTVRRSREDLEDRLTPRLLAELEADLPLLYERARAMAGEDLVEHGERRTAERLPDVCPYGIAHIVGHDWWPAGTDEDA